MGRVLHLLASGNVGGIEILSKDIQKYTKRDSFFCFVFSGGLVYDEMKNYDKKRVFLLSGKNSFHYFKIRAKIKKICMELNISNIVCHHESPILWNICRHIKKTIGVNYYLYVHCCCNDYFGHGIKGFMSYHIFRHSYENAKAMICISNHVMSTMISKNKFFASKAIINYNGVDLSKFTPSFDKKTFRIVYVGRLTYEKGIDYTLMALSSLKSMNIVFDIVGDGPYREHLENMTFQLGLDNVNFIGSSRNVADILSKAAVFIHTPRWEEGFGISIVEALASGLPVISFYNGAIPEIINDDNGILCHQGNVNEVCEAIKTLYDSFKNRIDWNKRMIKVINSSNLWRIQNTVNCLDEMMNGDI